MLDRRLIRAEVLKLRRRRGLLALSGGTLLLTVVAIGVANATSDTAGGADRFLDAVAILSMIGSIVGVLIGGTAGAQDLETGVFRDLAATGRPRLALYGARVAGAWAVLLPMLLAAVGFEAAWCLALAGDAPGLTAGDALAGVCGVLVSGAFISAACVGIGALAGSRGPVIGIALGFQLGVSPLLAEIGALGDGRRAIPQMAVARIGDSGGLDGYPLGLAIVVLLAWSAVLLGAGARRTLVQEI